MLKSDINKLAILHIKGTKNNTILVVTDITGQEIIFKTSGGISTKNDRDKSSQKIGVLMFNKLVQELRDKKIKNLQIRMRNKGSMYDKNITSAIKFLIGSFPSDFTITDKIVVNPIIHGYMRKKGGRRGVRK
jgi:ribosomal protein S11